MHYSRNVVEKSLSFVSVTEACDLLQRLEARTLARLGWTITPRQLRYLDTCGVLQPGRVDGARLYTAADVALLRLFLRLVAAGATESRVRSALVYLGAELRREVERPASDRALLLMGARGLIVPASECQRWRGQQPCISVAEVVKGTGEAVEAVRAADAYIWTGRRFETSSTLAAAVVHAG